MDVSDPEKKAAVEFNSEEVATPEADQRIQFAPHVKPSRGQDVSKNTVPMGSRSQSIAHSVTSVRSRGRQGSVHSLPPVYTEKEKKRRQREKEDEKKRVDIDEHLLPTEEVVARYKTNINIARPGESQGLSSHAAENLLLEHGRNVLTPVKKVHPIIKYLQYLSSLFNLLLILAGALEYILLGINFKENFQNVSTESPGKCESC